MITVGHLGETHLLLCPRKLQTEFIRTAKMATSFKTALDAGGPSTITTILKPNSSKNELQKHPLLDLPHFQKLSDILHGLSFLKYLLPTKHDSPGFSPYIFKLFAKKLVNTRTIFILTSIK
mmetsp:Transcript_16549/g.36027  ORF Transcript_16549/g.36027 Transcript_16549/m.36027 type:complete len:121 (+) Transcript_16549:1492-1854(+)